MGKDRTREAILDATDGLERQLLDKVAVVFLRETRGLLSARKRAEIVSRTCYPLTEAAVRMRDRRMGERD